ncbi:MAG: C25 family cysteine peptidase [Bacteroidales bacterium]
MNNLRNILLALLLILVIPAYAQYSNSWIDFSQSYYKIKVANDGIYRINYATLQAYGFPVNSVNPLNIQVFGRGEEVPLYIEGENDGSFDPSDYIEFYARANDGWFDEQLYIDSGGHLNNDYSLFSDTAVYFLTWNNSTANKRFLISDQNNFNNYAAESHYKKVVREEYTSRYLEGDPESYGVTDPEYTGGEGWFDYPFSLGNSRAKTISTPGVYPVGPQAKVRIAVVGASDYEDANGYDVSPDHHLKIEFANQVIDTLYNGYGVFRFNRSIAPSYLNSSNTFLFQSIDDLGVGADRNAISSIEIAYPKAPSLNSDTTEYFFIDDASSGYRRIDFSGFSASAGANVYVYDLTNGKRIEVFKNNNDYQVLIPNGGGEKQCLLTSSDNVQLVAELFPVSNTSTPNQFTNFANRSEDYIIISHKNLIENPDQSIQNYAAYRTSQGQNTMIVDVDDLYHQFAYGIHNHPLGIRKFVEFVYQEFTSAPDYLFLIGKGYRASDANTRRGNLYHENMVPSMGNAPSDLLFSAGLLDSLYQPAIATGRLAAKNTDHVNLYLSKVQEYDAARVQAGAWQKRILHFAGGNSTAEQNMIRNNLHSYEQIAKDTFLGAHVHTFYKTTTDPIQIDQVDNIRTYINEGVLMLTFNGHSAGGVGFDISIDDPVTYNNQGKYPFLLANSCFAGDLFVTSESSSEQWVLEENKGVIGYLASISPALPSSLHTYSTSFYRNMSADMYGQSLGKLVQQTIQDIQLDNFARKEISLAMTLHGDPALSLYNSDKPDYEIQANDIDLDPTVITSDLDTFKVHLYLSNIGKAIDDSVFVEVKRTFPGSQITNAHLYNIKAPYNRDTLTIRLPVNPSDGVGLNKLEVTIDSYNAITELSEANNSASMQFDIKSSSVIPVDPPDFAIIPNASATLKVSTVDPFVDERDYVFQLDTTNDFNSPLLVSGTVKSSGGVIEWVPPVSFVDSMVYYWRVSQDSVYSGNYDWRMSSFQYVPNQRGWGQSHFPQFLENEFQFVQPKNQKRLFEFINVSNQINVTTGVYPNIGKADITFRLNNDSRNRWTCLTQHPDYIGLIFTVFDTISGKPFLSHLNEVNADGLGRYNNVHCVNNYMSSFQYFTTSTLNYNGQYQASQAWWFDQIERFIDSLPAGTPVLAYSVQNHNAENFTNAMYETFESFGSGLIRTINNDQPYIIYGKKGDVVGSANEMAGIGPQDILNFKDSIQTRWQEGYIKSPVIGPSQKWQSLHWNFAYSDSLPVDEVHLDVVGIKNDGSVDTVINQLSPDSLTISNLGNRINAQQYPKIQLILVTSDDSLNTPAQLKKWQVYYVGVPETAINPKKEFSFYKDTVMQGDTVSLSLATENISDYDMDSLKVKYWMVDHNRIQHPVAEYFLRPHPAADVLIDSISLETKGLEGTNKLWVEFNPNNNQPEQTHRNNLAEMPFYVKTDEKNPLLDVTFDGVRIMDGDIVSARPNIIISLKDENQYLALEDTANINVFIKNPSSQKYNRLNFSASGMDQLRFYPASLPDNECKVEYEGDFPEDGVYNLRVQARDATGNKSGDVDYDINFEVVNKASITNVLNWPNPFSTRTHFVFTLTGSRVPDYMKIQIMTVTGKVVREIEMDELGPIHIGKNITDYAWDGTDEYGDRLANGVYLYRVITDMNGGAIDKRETAADQYFTKGFGKMYLIR